MNEEKVKLIIQNMEMLLQSLKDELNDRHNYSYSPYIDDDVEYYSEEDNV